MIPDLELRFILSAANNYRILAKNSNVIDSLLGLEFPSLDDRCTFAGHNHTVEQLLEELTKNSVLGQKFARAVYQRYQGGRQLEGSQRLLGYEKAIYEITHPNQN